VQLLKKFEAGEAVDGDVDKLLDICDDIGGKSFCALADGAVACVTSAVRHFRGEFEDGYKTPAWELFPYGASALFPVSEKVGAHA
jgi:NADH-quinone oxidoreductase subunit F